MIFKYNDRRSTPRTAAMSFSVLFRYALYIDSTRTVHRSSTDDRLAVPIPFDCLATSLCESECTCQKPYTNTVDIGI